MGRHTSDDPGKVATNPFRAIQPAHGEHLSDNETDHPARRALWSIGLCLGMVAGAGLLGYGMGSPAEAERVVTIQTVTAEPSGTIRPALVRITKTASGPIIYRTRPPITIPGPTVYRTTSAKPRPAVTVTETERIRVPVPGPTITVTETETMVCADCE